MIDSDKIKLAGKFVFILFLFGARISHESFVAESGSIKFVDVVYVYNCINCYVNKITDFMSKYMNKSLSLDVKSIYTHFFLNASV